MSNALQTEVEKTIIDLGRFRDSLKVRLDIVDDKLVGFTDALKDIKKLKKATIPKTENAVSSHKVNMSSHAERLKKHLLELGAGDKWVKCSYTFISSDLNIQLTLVTGILDELKRNGLKVVRIMSGELKGNNFTFADIAPPVEKPVDKPNEPPAPKPSAVENHSGKKTLERSSSSSDDLEQLLLEKLRAQCSKIKMPSFGINLKNLSNMVKAKSTDVHAALHRLQDEGEIKITRFNKSTWEYVFYIPEGV